MFAAWQARVLRGFGTRPKARRFHPVRACRPVYDLHDEAFFCDPALGNRGLARIARMPHQPCDTRAHRADYFEMVSSAMPFVRGPIHPIAAITTTIAPAMNANTPNVPKPRSTAAITNDEKIAEKRLHE